LVLTLEAERIANDDEKMPVYEYACEKCGLVFDRVRPYADREFFIKCPECGGWGQYQVAAPLIGTGRVRGDKRLIWNEAQVVSDKGADWRDEGTTRREGGVGRTLYF
jgi:putative FmdB family regulatory protein